MNTYVTGSTIRQLREIKHLTQAELAAKLSVSAKTISKWGDRQGSARHLPAGTAGCGSGGQRAGTDAGRARGQPEPGRQPPAFQALCLPLCGNVLHATGQAVVSCCGITLPALDIAEAEDADEHHQLTVERVEDELFVTLHHPMEKNHYISFHGLPHRR